VNTPTAISNVLHDVRSDVESALVYYEGVFDQESLDNLIKKVEEVISTELNSSVIAKKVFNVSVEISQNLFHYFSKEELPKYYANGLFVLDGGGNRVGLTTGNFIKKEQAGTVVNRIEMINGMSPGELKSFYRGILDSGNFSDQGGAGLGFIDIARKSGNKIEYQLIDVNDEFVFLLLKININE